MNLNPQTKLSGWQVGIGWYAVMAAVLWLDALVKAALAPAIVRYLRWRIERQQTPPDPDTAIDGAAGG